MGGMWGWSVVVDDWRGLCMVVGSLSIVPVAPVLKTGFSLFYFISLVIVYRDSQLS
jgi:hypothetical protein